MAEQLVRTVDQMNLQMRLKPTIRCNGVGRIGEWAENAVP
jgi:hypothetical protein